MTPPVKVLEAAPAAAPARTPDAPAWRLWPVRALVVRMPAAGVRWSPLPGLAKIQGRRRLVAGQDRHARASELRRIAPIVSLDSARAAWPQQLPAAKRTWSELTDGALHDVDGRRPMSASLDQQRYDLTREDADEQVRRFFAEGSS